MLSVAEENKKLLIVEPAVADSITGDKWNRYIFRTSRNSTQDALAAAVALGKGEVSIATLAQDYAFGRDGVAALKGALAATNSPAKVVFEEYAPQTTTDFTASAQRLFDALKDKPGRKVIVIIWAGPNPLTKIADLKPDRFGIELARHLVADPAHDATVILISTRRESELADLTAMGPAAGFLSKSELSADAIRAFVEPLSASRGT